MHRRTKRRESASRTNCSATKQRLSGQSDGGEACSNTLSIFPRGSLHPRRDHGPAQRDVLQHPDGTTDCQTWRTTLRLYSRPETLETNRASNSIQQRGLIAIWYCTTYRIPCSTSHTWSSASSGKGRLGTHGTFTKVITSVIRRRASSSSAIVFELDRV